MSNKNNELVRKDMYGMDPFFNDFFNFPFFENRKNHHPIMKTMVIVILWLLIYLVFQKMKSLYRWKMVILL